MKTKSKKLLKSDWVRAVKLFPSCNFVGINEK